MVILGGSLHHPGGLEAFCERAAIAVDRHAAGWQAWWWPTNTAYFSWRRLGDVGRVWRELSRLQGVDLVWLQWSTSLDLLFLLLAKARGLPVMITPHLGAASRLQRVPAVRRLCVRLLGCGDRIGLLFDDQDDEIALPRTIPRSTVGTFLPEDTFNAPADPKRGGPLRLIHAGRLSIEKGTFRMVALCALLRERGVPFDARIVGRSDPETMAALGAAIADAGLGDALTLTGWMDEAALRGALTEADLLVHLSELDSFPLIVLEALAAGALPIVAPMAGAAEMVRRHDGFVARGSSVTAVADWIAGQEPAALRRRGAAAAMQVREDRRWEKVVAAVQSAAEATLAGIARDRAN